MIKKLAAFGAAAIALPILMFALPSQAVDPQTVVSLTFDDTNANNIPALDLMQSRGLKGTLYVNSQRLGYSPGYLSNAQLKGYSQNGFEVGGHSLNHEDLRLLGYADAKVNICADRTNLMNQGYRVTSLAYPYGAQDATTQQAARECGYNSARGVSGLRTPTSSQTLPVRETIPPANPYLIRTPSVIGPNFTLDQYKKMVTDAEAAGGGHVTFVFHHICDNACTNNSISMADFTALVDWLQTRPSTTVVKTVDEVVGGSMQPMPGGGQPTPGPDAVVIGSRQHVITGVNILRSSGSLILYTPVVGARTKTNAYGTEVTVVGGVVTKVENSVGNAVIPANGYVLSGHGESATWLKAWAPVGTVVTLQSPPGPTPTPTPTETTPTPTPTETTPTPTPTETTPTPTPTETTPTPTPTETTPTPTPTETTPPPVLIPTTNVTIGGASHLVNGTNIYRASGFLVVYTPARGATTLTNEFGFEVVVVDGKVVQVVDKVGNIAIPANGYVLSGHGESRTWLRARAVVGATVTP